jgi:hypothetical protein
MAKGFVVWVVC